MNNKMKKHILLLITSLTIVSCFTDDELPFDFSDDLKKTVIPYQENDLIYFKNQLEDLDTLRISSKKTIEQNDSFSVQAFKNVTVSCEHLPFNKWTEGFIFSTESNENEIINQELITISADENSESLSIRYRDFSIFVNELPEKKESDLLNDLNLREYWEFIDSNPNNEPSSIIKIIWTEKYGLTAYYNMEGDFYLITNVR